MKTALITGANKGIGFETARQLLERNFKVILTARNEKRGLQAVDKLNKYGSNIEFLLLDVEDEESIKNAAGDFNKLEIKLDVIINNAGILLDNESINTTNYEIIFKTLKINTIGPILVIQNFLPYLNDYGRIINVSSGLGLFSEMSDFAPVYSISKAALNAVTKQFSFSLAEKNISINSVSPGWVKTDMGGPNAVRPVEKVQKQLSG